MTIENLQGTPHGTHPPSLHLQVAFVKLKIPVTDRQLRRVAEALMRDIRAQHSTLNPAKGDTKAARCAWSILTQFCTVLVSAGTDPLRPLLLPVARDQALVSAVRHAG